VANLGRAVHRGAEASVSYDLLARHNPAGRHDVHPALTVYANALLLDASFREGPNAGRIPQYAPRHLVRSGVVFSRGDALKLALTGTLSARSYGDDNNSAQRQLPAYAVWDLTAEWRVPGSPVRLMGGVNNLLDEDYYSRVSAAGIDPAPRRNYYVGAALEF
jgi:Fe(3+) dicitrate transport protein